MERLLGRSGHCGVWSESCLQRKLWDYWRKRKVLSNEAKTRTCIDQRCRHINHTGVPCLLFFLHRPYYV